MAVEHRAPDRVLRLANDVTTALTDEDGPFVTVCFGVVDLAAGTFSFSRAGHLPPLLVRAGTAEYLESPHNPPLAVAAGLDFDGGEVPIRPGDRLVLFTDGLVERRDEIIDAGLARLAAAAVGLGADPGDASWDAQEAAERLGASVGAPQDDLAVVVVDIPTGSPPDDPMADDPVTVDPATGDPVAGP
jgi:hypothetical protein